MTKKQAMPYMNLYTTYLDDIDFIELDRSTRSRYWDFYLLAWNADAGGHIVNRETGKPLSARHIAVRLRDEQTAVEQDLAALEQAGFISRHGEVWHLSRYQTEQDDQEAMRKKWSGRQARHRSKVKESDEEESQANQMELINEEKKNPTNDQNNPTNLKSHADVTRDSGDEVDGMLERLDGLIPSLSTQPTRREALPEGMHPAMHLMAKIWREHMGQHITRYAQRIINQALFDNINPEDIADRIETTATHEATNPNGYFAECLKGLYQDKQRADRA